jgi:hypothetical protein
LSKVFIVIGDFGPGVFCLVVGGTLALTFSCCLTSFLANWESELQSCDGFFCVLGFWMLGSKSPLSLGDLGRLVGRGITSGVLRANRLFYTAWRQPSSVTHGGARGALGVGDNTGDGGDSEKRGLLVRVQYFTQMCGSMPVKLYN